MNKLVVAMMMMGLGAPAFAKGKDDKKPAAAAEAKTDDKLTGEVLDLNCYVGHGAHGDKHASCAQKCIAGGAPVGLLADGTVYMLVNSDHSMKLSEKLAPLAGTTVTLSGHKKDLEGGGHAFDVASVETK